MAHTQRAPNKRIMSARRTHKERLAQSERSEELKTLNDERMVSER